MEKTSSAAEIKTRIERFMNWAGYRKEEELEALQKPEEFVPIRTTKKTKHTGTIIKRRKMSDLENMYAMDPIVFNSVNILVSFFQASGYTITSKTDSVTDKFIEWLEGVNFDDKIEQIALHMCIYGNGWLENVLNGNKTNFVDIILIDPKTMDFKRKKRGSQDATRGRVTVDGHGKPSGYVQRLNTYATCPDPFLNVEKTIPLKPEQITHFRLRKVGTAFMGLGVVEPIWKATMIKLNLEEALGESVYHIGFPTYLTTVGTDEKPATLDQIDKYSDMVAGLDSKRDVTVPHYVNIKILESKEVKDMRNNLDHFINSQVAGLGVAKAYVMGSGESSNRSSLEFLSDVGDKNVAFIQKSVARSVNKVIIPLWAKYNKIDKKDWPKITFKKINRRDIKAFLRSIYEGITCGAITPDEALEKYLRQMMELPKLEGPRPDPAAIKDALPKGVTATKKTFPPRIMQDVDDSLAHQKHLDKKKDGFIPNKED